MKCLPCILAFCLTALLPAAGCSRPGSELDLVPVRGKVTFQGQPVAQGIVTFQPLEPAAGIPFRPASGAIDKDGAYQLSTFTSGDGVIRGEYLVIINTMTSGPTPEDPNLPEVWAAPKKYGDPIQSPLKASVPKDAPGPLELNFDLEK